jgi:hypothetical protein
MKKIFKKALYITISLVVVIFILGLILAFLPARSKTNHFGISPEEAANLRENFKDAHNQLTTTDGQTLFLRRWNPDSTVPAKKDIADLSESVKEFYNTVPGNKKEFLVMKDATHARFPVESWEDIVIWLNKTF